jgi:lipopolysaccharide transport system permease protein
MMRKKKSLGASAKPFTMLLWCRVRMISFSLGWQDLKQFYRRSSFGPFWLTIGMSVQIAAIGSVFGLVLKASMEDFLPFLAVSLILWSFLSGSILDGSGAFVAGEAIIRQLPLPSSIQTLRAIWKNLLMLSHNLLILPVVFLVFQKSATWNIFLVLPGLVVTSAFLVSASYILGLIASRYRDVQQIILSVMTVMFYVTPVLWQPSLIPSGTAHLLLGLNPLYHFLQIIRLPILGQAPTFENWALSISFTLISGLIAYLASKKYKDRLAYWV